MSQVQRNILANFFGKVWPALMGLAFVPLYVRLMGIEAYGLVGFFATLQMVFALLDMGLSTTLNREIARFSAQTGAEQQMCDLVRTLELIYWAMASIIIVVTILLAPWLAHHWIQSQHLLPEAVQQAVLMMGLSIALQFPSALYTGGLLGLQQQVLLNGLTVLLVTVRGAGAVLVLWLFSPTIQVFFGWQVLMSVALTCASGLSLWHHLPKSVVPPRFQKELLLGVWRFAAGMSGIGILAVILSQLDKVILSRLLTLEMFGYYSLAAVVSSGLYLLASPFYTAVFPRFSQLVSQGDNEHLKILYHQSCQLVSVAVLPASIIVALFAREFLLLWTRHSLTAEHTHRLVSLLITGTALNTLAITPQALQFAHGWTKLALYQNVLAAFLLVPLMVWMVNHYGAAGAAFVWIVLNASYVFIGVSIMHRRLLKGELWQWFVVDTGLPFTGALLMAAICRWQFPVSASLPLSIAYLIIAALLTLLVSVVVTPSTRDWLMRYMVRGKGILCEQLRIEQE